MVATAEVAVTRDWKHAYVTNDTTTNMVVATVPVGGDPQGSASPRTRNTRTSRIDQVPPNRLAIALQHDMEAPIAVTDLVCTISCVYGVETDRLRRFRLRRANLSQG